MSVTRTVYNLCRMVKIEHSVFALPFAFCGALLAAQGLPGLKTVIFLTVAMVCVRTFAMTMNRIADVRFDSLNPRTRERHLVTGEISMKQAKVFAAVTAGLFLLSCAGLNTLCLALSPAALIFCMGYNYVKRFSWLCHFVLGVVLGFAPLAGWLSVTGSFAVTPLLLFFGVVFWVAGFDILYATQDTGFDKSIGLHSVPAKFGIPTALVMSSFCHLNTSIFLFMTGYSGGLGLSWFLVWGVVSAVLFYEHVMLSADDLSRVNAAFFLMNGIVAVLVFVGVLWATWNFS